MEFTTQPKTLAEAVDLIYTSIDPVELEKTRALTQTMDLDEMAGRAHHTLGRVLRNELHLWEDESGDLRQSIWDSLPPDKQDYYQSWWAKHGQDLTGRNMHADDASHTLLVAVLKKIKGDA